MFMKLTHEGEAKNLTLCGQSVNVINLCLIIYSKCCLWVLLCVPLIWHGSLIFGSSRPKLGSKESRNFFHIITFTKFDNYT